MQTVKGNEAKKTTAREFADRVMEPLRKKAERIMAEHADQLANPDDSEPVYSFDKYSVHGRAQEQIPWLHEADEFGNVFPLCHHAGDIHKVIEHVIANLVTSMRKFVTAQPQGLTQDAYRAKLKSLFFQLKASSVPKDIESLPATLDIICKPVEEGGTWGDWAPRPYN
jgi:hypothetical protein